MPSPNTPKTKYIAKNTPVKKSSYDQALATNGGITGKAKPLSKAIPIRHPSYLYTKRTWKDTLRGIIKGQPNKPTHRLTK